MPEKSMFCDKCGNPIPDGQDHCPNCQGAPEAQSEQIEFFPTTAPETAEFQLNMPQETPAEPEAKKSSGKKIALLAGGAAVLVVLVGLLIAWACGAFRSPRQQLLHIEKTGAKIAATAIAEGYGAYMEAMGQQLPTENGYSMAADYRLSMHESALTGLLTGLTGTDMSGVDLSWLQHLLIHVDMSTEDSQMDAGFGIGINNTVVVSLDMILDMAQGKAFLGIPELNSQYLKAEMDVSGISSDYMSKSVALVAKLAEDMPEKDAVQDMLNRYFDIALGYIETVEKSTETVTAGDLDETVTVLKLTLSQEQLVDMFTEIMTTAKTDETLKQFFTAISNYYNGISALNYADSGYEYEPEDIYQEFLYSLEEALAELEETRDSLDPANYMVISNYVYKNVILGRKLEVFSKDEAPMAAHYLVLTGKDGYSFEAVWGDGSITGSGEGDAVEFTLTTDGEELFTVQTEGLEYADNTISGTIRLYPSEAMLAEMGLDDSYAFMADLAGCYLELSISSSQESGNMKISVVAGGETIIALEVDSTVKMEADITMPETAMDPNNDADMEQWVRTLSFDTLIVNLEKAGVPSDYVEVVRQLASLLSLYLTTPV